MVRSERLIPQPKTLVKAHQTVNLPKHGVNITNYVYTQPSPDCMTLTIFEATNNSGGFYNKSRVTSHDVTTRRAPI